MKKMTANEMRQRWPRLLEHVSETLKFEAKTDIQGQTKLQSEFLSAFLFQFIEMNAQLSELNDSLKQLIKDRRMHFLGNKSTSGALEAPKPQKATQEEISRVMSALGRRGGKKGGKRRLETMTQKKRSDIAFKAARARWDKVSKD
jgi:hypothetical protein